MPLLLKNVPASRGPRWVGEAFRLFGRRPLAFTMLFMLFLLAAFVVAQVPLLGGLAQMMALPLLSLGFMIAGQSALLDGPVRPMQFFEPLRTDPARRRALLLLCLIYGVSALAILLLADAVSGNAWGRLQQLMAKGDAAQAEVDALLSEPGVATGIMLLIGLGSVLSIPFWHAPALVHWGGQGVAQSLFSSTLAVWRNKGAFVTYFAAWIVVVMGFGLASALLLGLLGAPQMAGLFGVPAGLVFSAVFYGSGLFTFNDCFGGTVPESPGNPESGGSAAG